MKNEEEKLSRLQQKHEEEERNFERVLKILREKSAPKRLKVSERSPLKIKDKTWFRNWVQDSANQEHRLETKKRQMFAHYRNRMNRRVHTEGLAPSD